MATLTEITTSLKAKYVVIVENDLHYQQDPLVVLGTFVQLSDFKKNRILLAVLATGNQALHDELKEFDDSFLGLEHDAELQQALLPKEVTEYLRNTKGEHLLKPNLIELLATALIINSFQELFLRNGILKVTDARYHTLLDALKAIPGLEITYYRSRPAQAELGSFAADISEGLVFTDSNFYISIVDKMLGQGHDESGKQFLAEDLPLLNENNGLRALAFLFTSTANDAMPESFEQYSLREIQKDGENIINVIEHCLTDSAYAIVFKSFRDGYLESSEKAFKSALRNQENIKHIAEKSLSEGISIFDSVRLWLDQVVQYHLEHYNISQLSYHLGLTRFFDESLGNHTTLKEYGAELEKLNSYELFDDNVNRKALPIFPGDIFYINGSYYILMGQVCDTLVRESGTRGAKIGELLKIVTKPFKNDDDEKFKVIVGKTKDIQILHFNNQKTDSFEVAVIEITSKNTYYADFEVLDLCAFNEEGKAEISFVSDEKTFVPLLTAEKRAFYAHLKEEFKSLYTKYQDKIDDPYKIVSKRSGIIIQKKLTFNTERVSRLKGRFYDSLYQQLNNYKARIDLNLIDPAKSTPSEKLLDIKFKHTGIEQAGIAVQLYKRKGEPSYITLAEIYESLDANFKNTLEKAGVVRLNDKNAAYFLTKKEGGDRLLLEVPLKYTDKSRKLKVPESDSIRYARIFNEELNERGFTYKDNGERGELNEIGEIKLDDIFRGITLLNNNKLLSVANGEVIIRSEELEVKQADVE
ncbi:hypothetical protein [Mucilaginibacter endophyticus]|uniref:hypothetical protein n=1 Tax=Mucilaginibacter endophyticus TaxID=2675003 RepID=UPI000E0DE382|nr:hypothetical protein [Mucilaginibacter endophyticus]